MPTPSPATNTEADLTSLEIEIRASVGSEDFARTKTLLERYRATIEQRVRTAVHPQAECLALSGRTQELFDWARSMTLITRAKYQARLGELRNASLYISAQAVQVRQPNLKLKA